MPSGHSGGHSGGGHFGGGSFSSHSGGHFGGSSFGSGVRGSFSGVRPHRPWYSPRVVVFGGRQVYLNSGRASAGSILGVLITIGIIITAIMGFIWLDCNDKISTIQNDYAFYQTMANDAADNALYQTIGEVYDIKRYESSDKYCIFYTFKTFDNKTVEGYTYYVYDHSQALYLKDHGVVLDLDTTFNKSNATTDSVPLDFRNTKLEDDAEYNDYTSQRGFVSTGTWVVGGITLLLGIANLMIRATAGKATEEQIAAEQQSTMTNNNSTQSTPAGTWRCGYCGTVNDNGKERCEGCGAMRQK